MKGATTVEQLHEFASGRGQELLAAAKDASNKAIATGIGVRNDLLEIPSLGKTVTVPMPATRSGYATNNPGGIPTSMPKPMTLQEANDALSEIGAKAFSQNPMDRNFNGIDQRRLYGQVRQELVAALDKADPTGYTSAAWQRMQQHYERGIAGLEPIQSAAAYRPGRTSGEAQFNTPAVMDYLRNPKNLGELRNRFGDQNVAALINVLTRGGGPLARDTLAPGTGAASEALMQTYGRGQGGAPQVIGSLLRTPFPSFGSRYAGRASYGLPPDLQKILDVALQRAGSAGLEPR